MIKKKQSNLDYDLGYYDLFIKVISFRLHQFLLW